MGSKPDPDQQLPKGTLFPEMEDIEERALNALLAEQSARLERNIRAIR